ncbi:MAG: protoheme IX farnesyltransferase [Haloarculaceae archaeon]
MTVRTLWSLTKPRIVALLTLTGVTALYAAGGAPLRTVGGFVVAGAAIAAGSAAFNCYYDRHLDRHMARTADRPLPADDLSPRAAIAFVLVLLAVGTAVGLSTLPLDTVAYMWLGVGSYAGVYTVGLKRRHWLGAVIGGSAGSFPVLAGWSAVAPIGPAALLLAALVFVWTPAHAWALAYVYREDFRAADVPTLPAVADGAVVRRAVWVSAALTAVVAAGAVPFAGRLYAVACLVALPAFLWAFWTYRRSGRAQAAVRAFFTSNLLLAALFTAWALDGVLSQPSAGAEAAAGIAILASFIGLWRARPSLGTVHSEAVALPRSVRRLAPWAGDADRFRG